MAGAERHVGAPCDLDHPALARATVRALRVPDPPGDRASAARLAARRPGNRLAPGHRPVHPRHRLHSPPRDLLVHRRGSRVDPLLLALRDGRRIPRAPGRPAALRDRLHARLRIRAGAGLPAHAPHGCGHGACVPAHHRRLPGSQQPLVRPPARAHLRALRARPRAAGRRAAGTPSGARPLVAGAGGGALGERAWRLLRRPRARRDLRGRGDGPSSAVRRRG